MTWYKDLKKFGGELPPGFNDLPIETQTKILDQQDAKIEDAVIRQGLKDQNKIRLGKPWFDRRTKEDIAVLYIKLINKNNRNTYGPQPQRCPYCGHGYLLANNVDESIECRVCGSEFKRISK